MCKHRIISIMKFTIIIPMLSLAISCVKPADTSQHIPPADVDADYCMDFRAFESDRPYAVPMARLVKKYRNFEPALLDVPENPYSNCERINIYTSCFFYFFDREEHIWIYGNNVHPPAAEISPVVQIDFPESEMIGIREGRKKEDLLQFKNKIIDAEIYKTFTCTPSVDTIINIKFRARITGECGNWPMPTWNIGAGGKDSVVAELSPDERTLVIRGNGKMMDFDFDDLEHDNRPWNEICEKENSKVVIEDGVTHIGKYAFLNCRLVSVTIPGSVTSIGDEAFLNMGVTVSITVLNPVPPRFSGSLEEYICGNVCWLRVPEGSVDAYREADGWKYFKRIKAIEKK